MLKVIPEMRRIKYTVIMFLLLSTPTLVDYYHQKGRYHPPSSQYLASDMIYKIYLILQFLQGNLG